jgi:hypothetical protein
MIVVCKKPTKRLVKGVRYNVLNLWNSGSNQRWLESTVEIEGLGRFSVSNFTDIDGKELPKTNIVTAQVNTTKSLDFNDFKEGDILVCKSDSYKTLAKNGMYKVEKKILIEQERKSFGGNKYTHKEFKIKFEGISRTMKFSGWRFRKLTADEVREISLNSVLLGEEPNIIKTAKIRKIDMVVDKDLELMRILSKSIIDENRHHLSIIDWGCQKSSSDLGATSEDFSQLMNMTLKDILAKIEKKS